MQIVHIIFAVLSAWRITELFTMDRLTARLRERFPIYLWTCVRCMSVWGAIAAAVLFWFYPMANWPLAMSWLYLLQLDIHNRLSRNKDRRIALDVDESMNITMNSNFSDRENLAVMQRVTANLLEKIQKTQPANQAMRRMG
jgi:hypothetical protein